MGKMNRKRVAVAVAIASVITLAAMAFGSDLGESFAWGNWVFNYNTGDRCGVFGC